MDEMTVNDTNSTMEFPPEIYVISAVEILICIFGLTGNSLAMIVVLHNPGLKMASSVFMFNLALADFLFLLSIPFSVAHLLMWSWIFGGFMCRIFYGLFGINLFASVYTLVAMSLDRYIAVCCIKWSDIRTRPNSIICCIIIWVAATLLTLPLLLYAQMTEAGDQCVLEWPQDERSNSAPAYAYYTMILGFILPLFLIVLFYTSIIIRLRKSSPGLTDVTLVNKKRRTRKVTFVVFCIILAFVICWLPYWCMQMVIITTRDDEVLSLAVTRFYHSATVLYICNSAINPILYGFFSNKFREGVLQVFKCTKDNTARDATYQSSRITTILHSLRVRKGSSKRRHDVTDIDAGNKTSIKTAREESQLLNSNGKANAEKLVEMKYILERDNSDDELAEDIVNV